MSTRVPSLRERTCRPHHRKNPPGLDPLYGLSYPPDHLRLLAFEGDPADITRGLLTFDRDLGAMPSLFDTTQLLLFERPGPKVSQAQARSCRRCRPIHRVCGPGGLSGRSM